jgi:hypothetical protein
MLFYSDLVELDLFPTLDPDEIQAFGCVCQANLLDAGDFVEAHDLLA